jgi:FtsP/CotA-like multicopper oxidase with cupredoxin domain
VHRVGAAAAAALLVGAAVVPAPAAAQAVPRTGVVCTTGAPGTPTFVLTASSGHIALADGNTMFMWGYSVAGRPFQHPGPVLCVTEGDTVTVILQNGLPEPVSIMFPGQEGVLADGAPAQPQFDAGGNLTSLTNAAAASGGSVTYRFVASSPGSFLYESGTAPNKQVRMGLFGTLIVRPLNDPTAATPTPIVRPGPVDYAYGRADSAFQPQDEFLVLLSEIDPYLHGSVETGTPFDWNGYRPRYWLINGRGFPDSIADNGAAWLPDQPYGALARIYPGSETSVPGRIHYLNVGTGNYPYHPHGNNGIVIGRDGSPLVGPAGQDLSFEKFAVNVGPSQTWDVVFRYYDAESYSAANPVTITVPELANQSIGMFYGGSPYLGDMGPMPPGMTTLNECGEFYILSHNHALFQITSWGAVMTGPITYLRVDPPLPNGCP